MRTLILAGCLVLLVLDGAAWSSAFARGDVITSRLQFYPERMIGQTVTLPLVKIAAVDADGFTVRQGSFPWKISGDPGELEVGGECYVRGVLVEPGHIVAEWHLAAPKRGGKKLLGFLGLAIAGAVVLLGVRPTKTGGALRG